MRPTIDIDVPATRGRGHPATRAARWSAGVLLVAQALLAGGCANDSAGPPEPGAAPAAVARIGGDRPGALRNVAGFDVDDAGRVFTVDADALQVFGPDGQLRFRYSGATDATWSRRYWTVLRAPDGTLILPVEGRGGFDIRAAGGEFIRAVNYAEAALVPGRSNLYDLQLDADGGLFVLDHGTERVLRFDQAGTFLGAFGSHSTEPGGFINPLSLAVDPAGFVYVAESQPARISRFTRAGVFLNRFSYTVGLPAYDWVVPSYFPVMSVTPTGNVLVHDGVTPRLEERTPEGALVRTISFATNVAPGVFRGFYGLKVDSGGRIYAMPGRLVERSDSGGVGVVSFARPYGADESEVEGLVALAGAPDGVWAITEHGTRVVHYDSGGRAVARWDDYWALGRPFRAIGADAAGGVWVAAQNELRVARLDPGGSVTPLFDVTPPPEWNPRPYDEIDTLVPDGSGGFFITLTRFGTPWVHLDAGGQILGTRALSAPDSYDTSFVGPVITGDHELWGIERSRYDIRRFQFDFTELNPVVLSPAPPQVEFGTSVLAMVVDPVGELTVSAVTPEPALLRFDPSGRRLADWLPAGVDGEKLMPALLAYDRRGHLYVGDRTRDTITIFAPALNYGPGAGVRP